jgi:hypothetical protein
MWGQIEKTEVANTYKLLNKRRKKLDDLGKDGLIVENCNEDGIVC